MLAAAAAPLLTGAMIRTHFDLAPVVLTCAALLALVAGAAAGRLRAPRARGGDQALPAAGGAAGARLAARAGGAASRGRGPRGARRRAGDCRRHRPGALAGGLPRLLRVPPRPAGAGGERPGPDAARARRPGLWRGGERELLPLRRPAASRPPTSWWRSAPRSCSRRSSRSRWPRGRGPERAQAAARLARSRSRRSPRSARCSRRSSWSGRSRSGRWRSRGACTRSRRPSPRRPC